MEECDAIIICFLFISNIVYRYISYFILVQYPNIRDSLFQPYRASYSTSHIRHKERKMHLRQSQFEFQPSPTLVGHRQTYTKESFH